MAQISKVQNAVEVYLRRKNREEHPQGSFDTAGRWYPSKEERCACCENVRSPSRAYPYSYMTHCRTLRHVAYLCGVSEEDMRRKLKEVAPPQRLSTDELYFKMVACVNGGLYSVFNGEKYELGVPKMERVRKAHAGGYYVYRTEKEALNAEFPHVSVHLHQPRVLLSVKVRGNYIKYDNGKIAFSTIIPHKVVEFAKSLRDR